MCQKGVNADQTKIMIGQANDSLAMSEQWLKQIHHLAEHAGMTDAKEQLEQAASLISDARDRLSAASDMVDSTSTGSEASVELV